MPGKNTSNWPAYSAVNSRASQAVGGIVDAEPRLHAGEAIAAAAEGLQGAAQLVWLRPVFGVVDHREAAARERQRDVERLRFGARPECRHRDHRHGQAALAGIERSACFAIVGLDRDDDVELLGRVVEPLDRRQQSVDRRGLPVERCDHRIGRQPIVAQLWRALARSPIDESAGQPQAEPGQEESGQYDFKDVDRCVCRQRGGGKQRQSQKRDRDDIAAPARRGGREIGPQLFQSRLMRARRWSCRRSAWRSD